MTGNKLVTQICVVVHDAEKTSANWARVLDVPAAEVVTIFPEGVYHYTNDEAADYQATDYKDCRVAKFELGNLVLELLQPGQGHSPWRTFLEQNGPGVMHVCLAVEDRKGFQRRLTDLGVGLPYHVGYYPGGSYSYVASREQLGLELSINHEGNYTDLIGNLLGGLAGPLDELR